MKYQFCKPFEGDINNDNYMTLATGYHECGEAAFDTNLNRHVAYMCAEHINENQQVTREVQIDHVKRFRSMGGPTGMDLDNYMEE